MMRDGSSNRRKVHDFVLIILERDKNYQHQAVKVIIIIYKEKWKNVCGCQCFLLHFMSLSGLKKEKKVEVVIKVGVHGSLT